MVTHRQPVRSSAARPWSTGAERRDDTSYLQLAGSAKTRPTSVLLWGAPVFTTGTPACQSADPDLFFPSEDEVLTTRDRQEQARKARALCRACPVLGECLTWALGHREVSGIWGGTNAWERSEMRKKAKAA